MHRRGFLGFFGAGAVAGPKLAAGIAENVATSMPLPPMGASSGGPVEAASEGSWRLRRIANLKRIISGKDPEAAQREAMLRLSLADNCDRVRLDGLRSVSPAHKQRMLIESTRERQDRMRRTDAVFELSRFLNGED